MYATAFYGVLDAAHRTLRVSSAGHPLPLHRAAIGHVSTLAGETAMCVLWDELRDVPCVEHPLEPHDTIAFYTDGITDRQAADGTMFDLDRLNDALTRAGAALRPTSSTSIIRELDAFAGGQEPDDDQTLLIVGLGS